MNDQISRDAQEFGRHVAAGGWRLGLLVARNVTPGDRMSAKSDVIGGNPPITSRPHDQPSLKVSATAFEKLSGAAGRNKVMIFYRAWNLAAADGKVRFPADKLKPGQEVKLPDDEDTPWKYYYQKAVVVPPKGNATTTQTPTKATKKAVPKKKRVTYPPLKTTNHGTNTSTARVAPQTEDSALIMKEARYLLELKRRYDPISEEELIEQEGLEPLTPRTLHSRIVVASLPQPIQQMILDRRLSVRKGEKLGDEALPDDFTRIALAGKLVDGLVSTDRYAANDLVDGYLEWSNDTRSTFLNTPGMTFAEAKELHKQDQRGRRQRAKTRKSDTAAEHAIPESAIGATYIERVTDFLAVIISVNDFIPKMGPIEKKLVANASREAVQCLVETLRAMGEPDGLGVAVDTRRNSARLKIVPGELSDRG